MDLTKITDHVDRAQANLFTFFTTSPKLRALVAIIVAEIQALEDVGYDLIVKRFLADAEGLQLDIIGMVVGEPRLGLGDDDYRALLYIVIDVNHSQGGAAEITNAAANLHGVRVRYRRNGEAAFHLEYLKATGSNLVTDGTMEAPGSNLIVNGEAEDPADPWDTVGNPTVTREPGSPGGVGTMVWRIAYGGTSNPSAYQDNVLTIGQSYNLVGYMRAVGGWFGRVFFGGTQAFQSTTSSSWQPINAVATCTSTETFTITYVGTSPGYVEFVGTIEAAPAHYTPENGADLTKQPGGPGAGSKVLRVAYDGTPDPGAGQDLGLVPGEEYRSRIWVLPDGSGARFRLRCDGVNHWISSPTAEWQLGDVTFTAGDSAMTLQAETSAAGYVDCDDWIVAPPADLEWLDRAERLLHRATMSGVNWCMVEGHTTKPFRFGGSAGSGFGDGHLGRVTGEMR